MQAKKMPPLVEAAQDNSNIKVITVDSITLCSGFGQKHSAKWKPYVGVTLAEIEQMLANPPSVAKELAQWAIFSNLMSREHSEQRNNGLFYALWADVDDSAGLKFEDIFSQAVNAVPYNLMAYTSRSATEENQKARIIVPLGKPVAGAQFVIMQKILNDRLEAAGIKPDRVTERAGQLCYLPNRGAFYDFQENLFSDDLTAECWSADVAAEQQRKQAEQDALRQRREAAKIKAMQRMASGEKSPIDAFNAAYDLDLWLNTCGYLQKGNRYVSPLSETGSPAVIITPEGNRWISHHGSDITAGIGKVSDTGETCSGDSFDLFTFYQHRNDRIAALKAAGDMFTTAEGVSITKQNQRDYMAAQGQELALAEFDQVTFETTLTDDGMINPLEAPAKEPRPTLWPELVDPFTEYVAPVFPLETLPEAFQDYATNKSKQSGFDVGGYAFCLLVMAANSIDHRGRLDAKIMHTPAKLWGGLNGSSGAGKTPILSAAKKFAQKIEEEKLEDSSRKLKNWKRAVESAAKEDKKTIPKPAWQQRMTGDMTTEALALLLVDNPDGVWTVQDEITEFIGSMDAYKSNSGKDRGAYLRAYDGGMHTVNRASKEPLVIENFSVGILAGVQPEKLAQLYKQNGGGSDGLFQRFLMYSLATPDDVDYFADHNPFAETELQKIFETITRFNKPECRLSGQALEALQNYHNAVRTLSQRTAGKRFAEHIDKYPGFICRVAFTLHCLECAEAGNNLTSCVSLETFRKAEKIMRVMYRHSETVYSKLDAQAIDVLDLVKSACEAILSKGWQTFKRGDLTRDATGWQGVDNVKAESAIDYLIEIGWLIDATPPEIPGKRGRKSSGVFMVHPEAHKKFTGHTERITLARLERYQALLKAAEERRGGIN